MSFDLTHITFAAFALLILGAGLGLALSKRFIYAAFLLFALLFGIAAIFIFAGAEFLAVSQLILYVGGILILMVFGIMLTRKRISGRAETALHQSIPAALVALLIGGIFCYILLPIDWGNLDSIQHANNPETGLSNPQFVGKQILSTYLIPFELMGFLLLLALVGAAHIARKEKFRETK